jgi:DNA invertase Pin-like site-specific DNA recombinase
MINDAKKGNFDLIITREVSRFARNTVDTLQYTRELRSHGVEVFFINDNIKTFDGDGELRLTIMATLAQDESRKTSIRVKAGQETSMKNGTIYGNGNILGYDRVDGNVVINPEQAATVRLIYDMYLAGNGFKLIKFELEKRGMKTSQGNTRWHEATIRNILLNSFYCGIITYHKQYVPDYLVQKKVNNKGEIEQLQVKGTHDPIVSEEEYKRVCRIMANRTCPFIKTSSNGKTEIGTTGKPATKNLWSIIGMCSCGHTLTRSTYSGGSKITKTAYRCKSVIQNGTPENRKKKGLPYENFCNTPYVATWKFELMAKYIFKEYLPNVEKAVGLAKDIIQQHLEDDVTNESSKTIIEVKKNERARLSKRFDRLLDMRTDGELSPDVFKKKSKDIQVQIDAYDKEIAELTEQENRRVTKGDYRLKLDEICKRLDEMIDFKKYSDTIPTNIVEAFVERIVVYEDHFEWYLRLGDESREPYLDSWWFDIFSTGKVYGSKDSPEKDVRHIKETADEHDCRIKVGEFVIGETYAKEFIQNTQVAHHFKTSMWKDIKFSIYV